MLKAAIKGSFLLLSLLMVSYNQPLALAETSCRKDGLYEETCSVSEVINSDKGETNTSSKKGAPQPENIPSHRCIFADSELSCSTGAGSWSQQAQAWCKPLTPQPPQTDPVWKNHTDGSIEVCTRPTGDLTPDPGMTYISWVPPREAQPAVDPGTVTKQLLADLQLRMDGITIDEALEGQRKIDSG